MGVIVYGFGGPVDSELPSDSREVVETVRNISYGYAGGTNIKRINSGN